MPPKIKVQSVVQSEPVTAKKMYRQPVLVSFGDVRVLTQAGGTLTAETGNNAPSCAGNSANKATPCVPSDRRLKENITRIGDHPFGIGLYLFEYKAQFKDSCGHDRQFGVMADEVEGVMPLAVITRPDGYKTVDYDMLGIRRVVH